MALSKHDREFRLPKVSYLDFKHLEMDRVLTAFFARLAYSGLPSRVHRTKELTTEVFVEEFLEHPEWFTGFNSHQEILSRWIETHLMDVVHRGNLAKQAIAAPRPLHGFTYRFRNAKHSRDYGAAQHLYETLYGARGGAGQKALEQLHRFFFRGHDRVTGGLDESVTLDVETQALLRLLDQVKDSPDTRYDRETYPPLCVGAADLLAEDVMRLLFYERFIPRSVMVDYLKVLVAFHLALGHLRLFKLLPALLAREGAEPICASCPMDPKSLDDPHGGCPYRIGLLLDVAGQPDSAMATLAERSADVHYRRIPGFVKSYLATKKLDELAAHLLSRERLTKPTAGFLTVGEVLGLLEPRHAGERDIFFGQRVTRLLEDSGGGAAAGVDPELEAVDQMGLEYSDAYIEMLVALDAARGNRSHRQYVTECIDSLLMKNRPGALVAQARVKSAPRRFVLDSRLLEVLLQVAVLQPGGALGFHTSKLRIEDLLTFLRERYGLYVDRFPRGDGFATPSIAERRALRSNFEAFTSRLREVGFYRDLSDAYVTQTVTPRYRIDFAGAAPGTGDGAKRDPEA